MTGQCGGGDGRACNGVRRGPWRAAARLAGGCASGGVIWAVATVAHAGGFEVPDTGARAAGRGGALAVGVEDLTALHYNPGALAKQRGTTILYNQNLLFHRASFTRAPLSQDVWGVDQKFDTVRDARKLFPLGLFAAVGTDFGLKNWTFAAGIYGPSAVGRHDYPEYGPQSFQLTDMNVLVAYYNLSAAWKYKDVFGIGATFQWVDLVSMKYSLVVDSAVTSALNPVPSSTSTQLTNELQLKDHTAATGILGLWYRPHRRIEIGMASRFVPVYLKAKGGVGVDKPEVLTGDIHVEMPLTLPANFRGGIRYIHEVASAPGLAPRRWFDVELDVFYENWRTIDAFRLKFDGEINGRDIQNLTIPKNWRDTVSVRLGSDIWALPPYLTVRLGGFYETPTQSGAYSHLDFPAFARGGLGTGLTAGAKGVYFTVGYMHVFQQSRTVSELGGKVFQQRPLAPCPAGCDGLSGVPANAGTFRSSFDLLNLGIELKFAELLAGRRRARAQKRSAPAAAAPASPPPGAEPGAPGPAAPAGAISSDSQPEPGAPATDGSSEPASDRDDPPPP